MLLHSFKGIQAILIGGHYPELNLVIQELFKRLP
jgi:hypothetical protein